MDGSRFDGRQLPRSEVQMRGGIGDRVAAYLSDLGKGVAQASTELIDIAAIKFW